jgi:hypothetical protein
VGEEIKIPTMARRIKKSKNNWVWRHISVPPLREWRQEDWLSPEV